MSRDRDGQRGQELRSRLNPRYSTGGAWGRRGVGGPVLGDVSQGGRGGGAHLEECREVN